MADGFQHRINAGRVAIGNQIEFFTKQFGMVASNWKDDDTRVTFADFAITERLFAELRKSFPNDLFCSEEGNADDEPYQMPQNGYAWILDPIDGTNNFALAIPFCAISLGLLKAGRPVYGFVYDHSRRMVVEGGPGRPILENRRRIPLPRDLDRQEYVGIGFPVPDGVLAHLHPLLSGPRIRSFGSTALSCVYAALGFLDGAVDFRARIWDVAAGIALMHAAGREFHFIGDPVLPLRSFHVNGPSTPFFAGHAEFCAKVGAILNAR